MDLQWLVIGVIISVALVLATSKVKR